MIIMSGDAPSKFDEGNELYVKVDDLNYSSKYVIDSQNKVDFHETIKKVSKGSVVFPKRGAAIMTNKVRILVEDSYMDTNMMALVSDKIDSEFLYNIISKEGLYKIADTSSIPQINNKHIEPYEVGLPRLDEQIRIGNFFKTIDTHIACQQFKYVKYKGDIIPIFYRNDERLSENTKFLHCNPSKVSLLTKKMKVHKILLFAHIEFKCSLLLIAVKVECCMNYVFFHQTWEQRKLGELAVIATGKLDANAMVENGEYDFYTSGIKKYKIDTFNFVGPAITIAGNGATVGYMHKADGKFNAYQRTYVLNEFKADREFLFSDIAVKLPKKINREVRNGNIPYIVLSMLSELDITLPDEITEQQKIGELFNTIDTHITYHQRDPPQ